MLKKLAIATVFASMLFVGVGCKSKCCGSEKCKTKCEKKKDCDKKKDCKKSEKK